MPRTKESAVIQYFEDAPIEVATAVLDIVKGKLKARASASAKPAKTRSRSKTAAPVRRRRRKSAPVEAVSYPPAEPVAVPA